MAAIFLSDVIDCINQWSSFMSGAARLRAIALMSNSACSHSNESCDYQIELELMAVGCCVY